MSVDTFVILCTTHLWAEKYCSERCDRFSGAVEQLDIEDCQCQYCRQELIFNSYTVYFNQCLCQEYACKWPGFLYKSKLCSCFLKNSIALLPL